ncbi:trigger factor [Candidatus Pelagibacter sp. RS40]|uniref:trigger factor n=1 Tax=Candidatus Pelagibacter sp. RS40 TaxID=1977865 RepID=UPI000A15373E|nr:trigger factor [Candidatus Pelagibacter sp. RS40]ARJ48534.1 trigger factor [Candidatus Pelagibacter sp. RS40]
MKVTVENKKGLQKDLKVFIDKKTISGYMDEKYDEIRKDVVLKGFRPGKVPTEILKRQFGKAVYGEVIDKVLKDTTTKALEENKIKPAGQPKIDLKSFGEGKDLEYIITVTELPNIDVSSINKIKVDDYEVKIDNTETDKRIDQIAKSQNNFKEVDEKYTAKTKDLVAFDYKATVDGNNFEGNEGKNTQLVLGKDLFIKGFDKQLEGVKKNDTKKVEVNLPENFPKKELINKKAVFDCKINSVKSPEDVKINDDFAKTLGATDLNNLKELISKQINDEFKNSLDLISKKQILEQIEKQKLDDLPQNLIEQEVQILSQGMKEDELKKNKKSLEEQAQKRIKTGLILNAFGEKNNIKVSQDEVNAEIQKQFRMMPGQEKMVKEYYEKNPSAIDGIRGSIYEEKIINEIKKSAKVNKKQISKNEAEKILKAENEKNLKEQEKLAKQSTDEKKTKVKENKETVSKKPKTPAKKKVQAKKVSKK